MTFEELNYPKGQDIILEYNFSTEQQFVEYLFKTFSEELLNYGCGYLDKSTSTKKPDEEFYTFHYKGDGMRETDVFFMIYEEDETITIEWKYNPIQTGYLVELNILNND